MMGLFILGNSFQVGKKLERLHTGPIGLTGFVLKFFEIFEQILKGVQIVPWGQQFRLKAQAMGLFKGPR